MPLRFRKKENDMRFVKMNGCGNDYVYFDLTSREAAERGADVIKAVPAISDRHFGVGGDGVVLILPSGVADVRMRMFNADGSEGKMCGNAVRCVGKYAYEAGLTEGRTKIAVETASGVKRLSLIVRDGVCTGASVEMGRAAFEASAIPLDESFLPEGYAPADTPFGRVWRDVPVCAYGRTWTGTAVSMGNPHFVIFTDENVESLDIGRVGKFIETHHLFPERVNVEFVNILSRDKLRMRVWERGSGETMACGTGSCAVVAAAVANGITRAGEEAEVLLNGGTLKVVFTEDGVTMTGNAETNFKGEYEI